MTNTLDEGYAEAAARRAARPATAATREPAPRRRARPLVALAVAGVAAILTIAAVQTRQHAPAAARARAALVAEVQRQTAEVDRLSRTEQALNGQITGLRGAALGSSAGRQAAARLSRLQVAAGTVALAGPGVEVTLDDARSPSPAPLAGGAKGAPSDGEAGRIQDHDIQQVANALWAAGAEAIAVNGQRLTSLSSIREAGDAILVDFRPLSPPYQVVALGNPDTLQADFAASPTAGQFRTYAQVYGLGFHVGALAHAQVPAATGLVLHAAAPLTPGARPSSPAPKGAP